MTDPTSNSPEASTASTGTPRWMRLALVASLAVNLAVAGLVGGAFLAHRGAPGGDRAEARDGPDISIGAMTQALSRDDRRALRDAVMADRQARRAAAVEDLRVLATVLRADPFDPGAVQAVFDRQVARLSDGLQSGQQVMAQRFTAMTPSERASMADRLEAVAANPHMMRGKGGGERSKP